jgi:pilus assembly protein Flp/PilA
MTAQLQYLRALITRRLSQMDDRGASAVEYGLLIAGIAVVIIAVVFTLGGKIHDLFKNTSDCLDSSGKSSTGVTCSQ